MLLEDAVRCVEEGADSRIGQSVCWFDVDDADAVVAIQQCKVGDVVSCPSVAIDIAQAHGLRANGAHRRVEVGQDEPSQFESALVHHVGAVGR